MYICTITCLSKASLLYYYYVPSEGVFPCTFPWMVVTSAWPCVVKIVASGTWIYFICHQLLLSCFVWVIGIKLLNHIGETQFSIYLITSYQLWHSKVLNLQKAGSVYTKLVTYVSDGFTHLVWNVMFVHCVCINSRTHVTFSHTNTHMRRSVIIEFHNYYNMWMYKCSFGI